MAKIIDEQVVKKIAGLAKLQLSPEELGKFTRELEGVFAYFEGVKQIDVSGIAETSQLDKFVREVLREDEVKSGLTQEQALKNAKRKNKAGYFVTSKIL